MSSTYAPLPFSYLAAGTQPPKTGFRKDEGLYGNRIDMAKPIPALRHDQPRGVSIDHMLRGGDLTPTPAERRRPNPDSGDSESAYGNVRLPRADVSMYQSQVDGPTPATDTPSGHHSNHSRSNPGGAASQIDDELATSTRPHSGDGVFDNFILKGPAESQASTTDASNRQTEDEGQPNRSRLEQLFTDHPSSSDVASARRLDPDVSDRLPRITDNINVDDSIELPEADNARTNSFRVTTSCRPNSFGSGDSKLMRRSSATETSTSYCCCCYSGVYCNKSRLCVLVALIFIVALLMFGVGFIAGWFVGQLQQQHSPVSAAAEVINATDTTTWPGQNDSFHTTQEQTAMVTATRLLSSIAETPSTAKSTSRSLWTSNSIVSAPATTSIVADSNSRSVQSVTTSL